MPKRLLLAKEIANVFGVPGHVIYSAIKQELAPDYVAGPFMLFAPEKLHEKLAAIAPRISATAFAAAAQNIQREVESQKRDSIDAELTTTNA